MKNQTMYIELTSDTTINGVPVKAGRQYTIGVDITESNAQHLLSLDFAKQIDALSKKS